MDFAAENPSPSVQRVAPAPPLLAGVASCQTLPEREGIGPEIEKEYPDGFVLDDRFRLREAIGRSQMSTIYRAEDLADRNRVVAIKVPLMRVESDPVSFGRFLREERIGATLNHPCLLKFIPVAARKSRPYIAMEYLDGCTLACVLHLTRPLPEADSLRIASAVCQGLKHMHDRGVIHRDLKPANIMILRSQSLALLDFGMTAEISTPRAVIAALTPLFGTPEYMSPEQVLNRKNDERTDIYSLGVVLYQMLTGVLPFHDDDPWKAAQMRATGDPVAPRKLNPAISPQAEEIVLRALQRRPADRYPDVAAFRAALDAPERVEVTGLCEGLKPPHFRLSLQGTPFLAGGLIGVGVVLSLVALFFLIVHFSKGGR
jgi:serine/threonine-protein kinase